MNGQQNYGPSSAGSFGGDWRPGVPPYLAIRHVLDVADSVAMAVKVLNSLTLASSRSIMPCDASEAGYVEVLGDELRFTRSSQPVHTNHYLNPAFTRADEINVFAGNSSRCRLDTCRQRLRELPASANAEQHFELLAAPPICVRDNGDIRRERTVAAVTRYPMTTADLGRLVLSVRLSAQGASGAVGQLGHAGRPRLGRAVRTPRRADRDDFGPRHPRLPGQEQPGVPAGMGETEDTRHCAGLARSRQEPL